MSAMITAAVVAGAIAANESDKAMKARRSENEKAIAAQKAAEAKAEAETKTYRATGERALASLEKMTSGDYDITETPGYEFRLEEGYKGVERSQSGRRLGGRAAKEMARYGQEYASDEYGKQFGRLKTLADYGQEGVRQVVGAQLHTADKVSATNIKQGEDYAEYHEQQSEIAQDTISNVWTAYNT